MKCAGGVAVATFIRDNAIYGFGIAKCLLFDDGTPFVNMHVQRLLDVYDSYHVKSSLYYLQESH